MTTDKQIPKYERAQYDLENAAWLLPPREAFHTWLMTRGFAQQAIPKPGCTYPGSHAQGLWECWLAASLQSKWISAEFPPHMTPYPGMWPRSDNVLVFTCGEILVAYRSQVDEDWAPQWTDAGSESWTLTGVTHWQPLPRAPDAPPQHDQSLGLLG